MRLKPGTCLGVYEVLQLVGAGGMGEVYKARDTRLDRIVAVKILPEEFVVDARRRERFEREARAIAALNHQHICSLHDVGQAARIPFLVMEYLEGQTLAERLLQGPLPIADVLRYSIQLADALAHAHARRLVHRDLKPGNVMLTDEGAKLLDFGLSRVQAVTGIPTLSTESAADAPLTSEGVVLGTYPYMSPEQLAGRDADARSDIFALGAIVYEMATGHRAFEGTTAATLIGAILHTDPPAVSSRQPLAPSALDRAVQRCLAKRPDDRWQTARDLTLELRAVSEESSPVLRHHNGLKAFAIAMIAIATIVMTFVLASRAGRSTSSNASTIRLVFTPPDDLKMAELVVGGPVQISPDGTHVVFVATGSDGAQQLWVRPLESLSARPLPGTDGAAYPFWSADSQSVGFFAQRRLKRVARSGGPPQILCDAVLPRGGTWNARGEIVFSAGAGRQMFRVSATGGPAMLLPEDEVNPERYWPSFLPDGRHYLYFARPKKYGVFVASIEAPGAKLLLSEYVSAMYATPGYIVGVLGAARGAPTGTLLAHAFDLSRLEVVGEPIPIAERVQYVSGYARAALSVSDNGILVYGTFPDSTTQLTWFDRKGTVLGTVEGSASFAQPEVSPDGRTIAVSRVDPVTHDEDIWLIDASRNLPARLTSHPNNITFMPVWSPDGSRLVFAWAHDAPPNLYQKLSGGGGDEELLVKPTLNNQPTDWSHDGQFVMFASLNEKSQWDLWYLTTRGATADREQTLYLRTEFNEHLGRFSPDGRWVTYVSDESGTNEVYVRRFPSGDGKTRVSSSGGTQPRWDGHANALIYLTPDNRLVTVPLRLDASVRVGSPETLMTIRTGLARTPPYEVDYSVSHDGQRFLIRTLVAGTSHTPTTIVLNWNAALHLR